MELRALFITSSLTIFSNENMSVTKDGYQVNEYFSNQLKGKVFDNIVGWTIIKIAMSVTRDGVP